MTLKEKQLREKIHELEGRIEVLNSNAEKDIKKFTEQGRVIDLLIMLGHLDDRALEAANKLIKTGLKL